MDGRVRVVFQLPGVGYFYQAQDDGWGDVHGPFTSADACALHERAHCVRRGVATPSVTTRTASSSAPSSVG